MQSCIYEGTVSHRRRQPVTHQFQYRLFMLYLDLDELPTLLGSRGLIATSRFAGCSFLRGDHLFEHGRPLAAEVREIVQERTGRWPRGRIRLLTQLRYFGYYFSPLNLFYLYDELDEDVECVVAEVSNTPWGERHCYVLWNGNRTDGTDAMHYSHRKQFHVSPFLHMDLEYRWQLGQPASRLNVCLSNYEKSRQLFDAVMTLQRRELSRQQLRRMTIRYPLMTVQIGAAIYYQALKLWWKKCPFYTHPSKMTLEQTQETERAKKKSSAKSLAAG